MIGTNKGARLKCSNDNLDIRWVENVSNLKITERTIVTNLGNANAIIKKAHQDSANPEQVQLLNSIQKYIAPWESTLFMDVTIESASLLLLITTPYIDNPDVANLALGNFPQLGSDIDKSLYLRNDILREQVIKNEKWQLYYDSVPESEREAILHWQQIPLFVTPDKFKTCFGPLTFDPYKMIGQKHEGDGAPVEYYLLSYVWFCPGQTNVGIHNQHKFIEIHTQISGIGRMQKFEKNDYSSLYYDFRMAPGTINVPFPVVNPEYPAMYIYPWHQYYADSDCLWLVTEIHRASEFDPDVYSKQR